MACRLGFYGDGFGFMVTGLVYGDGLDFKQWIWFYGDGLGFKVRGLVLR